MKKGYKQLLTEANAVIETITAAEALQALGQQEVVFVDIRDQPELECHGKIPGAVHASRGMLEVIVDPDSSFHQPVFSANRRFLLYCAGGVRSAFAAQRLQEMGLEHVAHIAGGINAWKQVGGPVEHVKQRERLSWIRR
ncbi:MAG: rhodanese-like domain-containing protein [Chloroflexota bacterium]|nr:rhodanese-like domain-containing protein [Chloroflexota bacterium]